MSDDGTQAPTEATAEEQPQAKVVKDDRFYVFWDRFALTSKEKKKRKAAVATSMDVDTGKASDCCV